MDLANATRIGGAIWWIGAAVTAVLLPLSPPDDAIGSAGWAFAAVVVVGALAGGARLRSAGPGINVDELLAHSYAAVAYLGVIVWLSGGIASPYEQLLLLSLIYTSAVHPPRRVAPYLLGFSLVALAPLAYDHPARSDVMGLVTELVMWLALALVAMALMQVVRAQRLGLRREGERARRQARVDPLTGLLNRRAFDEALEHAVDQARASALPLSVLVCDLDDFKATNDQFGHLEGDRLLDAVAESLRAALRGGDDAYRWGGDEFALILPGTDARGGEQVAERIRAAVATNSTPDGTPLRVAVGVAQLRPGAPAAGQDLLAEADEALLRSKGSDPFLETGTARG